MHTKFVHYDDRYFIYFFLILLVFLQHNFNVNHDFFF